MNLINSFIFILICINVFSQDKRHLYIRFDLYDHQTITQLKENYKPYFILTPSYIDSDNDNEIEYDLVERTIKKWFPNKLDSSCLIIDWERQYFKDLKKLSSHTDGFKKAKNNFINLILFIKEIRPNLKLSVYGIPYRFNYPFQRIKDNRIYDEILNYCDFIAPSLYISFLEPKNSKRNKKILEENLRDALEIGKRLNKPVIPFVWYKYGGDRPETKEKLIDKNNLEEILNFITTFKYKDQSVCSLLWWDSYSIIFNENFKMKNIQERKDILKYYDIL